MDLASLHELGSDTVRIVPISKGGQISIPAPVRHRWAADRVRVTDHGDRLVVEPVDADPVGAARGALPLPPGITSERLRAAREDDDLAEDRR